MWRSSEEAILEYKVKSPVSSRLKRDQDIALYLTFQVVVQCIHIASDFASRYNFHGQTEIRVGCQIVEWILRVLTLCVVLGLQIVVYGTGEANHTGNSGSIRSKSHGITCVVVHATNSHVCCSIVEHVWHWCASAIIGGLREQSWAYYIPTQSCAVT